MEYVHTSDDKTHGFCEKKMTNKFKKSSSLNMTHTLNSVVKTQQSE